GLVEARAQQRAHRPEHGGEPAIVRMPGLLREAAERVQVLLDAGEIPELETREQPPAASVGGELSITSATREIENRRRQDLAVLRVAGLHQHDESPHQRVAERSGIADAL